MADQQPDLDDLVEAWLTLPDLGDLLGLPVTAARHLVRDGRVAAVRRGPNSALYVPAAFVLDGRLAKGLEGTLTVLADAGYDHAAAVRWLFTPDASLPGRPIDALRENRGTEVRRRAQALAL